MYPLHGAIAPLDVHGLTLGEPVVSRTERVRNLPGQFDLFLHRRVERRVEARRGEHSTCGKGGST